MSSLYRTSSSVPHDVWEALKLTNDYRAKKRSNALCLNPQLTAAASGHASDMGSKSFLSHVGSDKSTVGVRVTRAGYAWNAVAENILFYSGTLSANKSISMWINSAGHEANLQNPIYQQMGLARAQGACPKGQIHKCWFWVQKFGRSSRNTTCWIPPSRLRSVSLDSTTTPKATKVTPTVKLGAEGGLGIFVAGVVLALLVLYRRSKKPKLLTAEPEQPLLQ